MNVGESPLNVKALQRLSGPQDHYLTFLPNKSDWCWTLQIVMTSLSRLLVPDRKPPAEQRTNTNKVQSTYRNMGEGCLQEQEQKWLIDSRITEAHKPGNLEHTAHLQVTQQVGEWRCLSPSQNLCKSASLREVFFAAWLCPSERDSQLWRQEGARWIWSVSRTSWSYSELFIFCLRSFLENGMF